VRERLTEIAAKENEAFEMLAMQLGVSLDELKRREKQRYTGRREHSA
jgi:hypothetical protein